MVCDESDAVLGSPRGLLTCFTNSYTVQGPQLGGVTPKMTPGDSLMVLAIKALFFHFQVGLTPPADAVRVSLLKDPSLYVHTCALAWCIACEIDTVLCMLM